MRKRSHRVSLRISSLTVSLICSMAGVAHSQNVVLLIADDLGVDASATYGEEEPVAPTPHLDQLANDGILFRNAWAQPTCSPTRAAILTGQSPSVNGVGWAIDGRYPERAHLLPDDATNLSRVLSAAGYRTGAFGKWHLGVEFGIRLADLFDETIGPTESHPGDLGFDHYEGYLFGGTDYYEWPKTINGVTEYSLQYATTDTANAVIQHLQGSEPFFLWVAFRAPHGPLQVPPLELLADPSIYDGFQTSRQIFMAMIEAIDTEIGRVLEAVDFTDTTVIYMGDNGTRGGLINPRLLIDHGKATVYEGGLNVPLIVAGQAVAAGAAGHEAAGLVQVTDIFSTIIELAGANSPPRGDAVSIVPYLSDPGMPSIRNAVFAEAFLPNGGPIDPHEHIRAARGKRFKLVRRGVLADELYDLWIDPYEQTPIPLWSLAPHQSAAYAMLQSVLRRSGEIPSVPSLTWVLFPLFASILFAARTRLRRVMKKRVRRVV